MKPNMTQTFNTLGQPVGFPMPDWIARALPPVTAMAGRYCRVEPLDLARHAAQLFQANSDDVQGRNWTYLLAEPPADFTAYRDWLAGICGLADPMFHAVIDLYTNQAVGVAAFMRIDQASGVIEVGHINFSPRLQRTRASTEAMFLMMRRAFDELGYRRYEWKCDSLNAPSRAAALRYGFQFEGVFRQALVGKQRNRDTAWFSILDSEWPQIKRAFEQWLHPDNFNAEGRQKNSLGSLMVASGGQPTNAGHA